MSYLRLDHVVVVVEDLLAAVADYESALGIPGVDIGHEFPERGYRSARFEFGDSQTFLELCQPTDTSKQAGRAMRRTLDRQGEGIHNIACAVGDMTATLGGAQARGVDVVRNASTYSFFIHPRDAHGVLIQILQRPMPVGRPPEWELAGPDDG